MQTIVGYLQSYYRDELQANGRAYILPVLSIALLTFLEYSFNLEAVLFNKNNGFWQLFFSQWMYMFLIWALPMWWINRASQLIWKPWLPWLLLVFAAYAFRLSFKVHQDWMSQQAHQWDLNTYYFYWYTLGQWFQAMCLIVPLLLIGIVAKGQLDTFHGLRKAKLKPYLILLIGAAIIVTIASTQADFKAYYPRVAKLWPMGGSWQWERILAFELSYALDFYATEYLFRGFLVLALVRYIGPKAILPMAILYVSIHFGKPLGETISSFFGGMLLGIFAYYSKSIWGGVLLHIGLAWMMELIVLL